MLVGYGPATVDKLGCQMSTYGHHVSPVYGPVLQFSWCPERLSRPLLSGLGLVLGSGAVSVFRSLLRDVTFSVPTRYS